MAVSLDANATAIAETTGTPVASLTLTTLTVGSGSNLVLVAQYSGEYGLSGIVRGTQNFTFICNVALTGATNYFTELWGLVNPTSGNIALVATLATPGGTYCVLNAASFTGANQTGGTTTFYNSNTATGSSAPITNTLTVAAGDATVQSTIVNAASRGPSGPSGTSLFSASDQGAGAQYALGALSSISWTTINGGGSDWASAAVAIKAAASGIAGAAAWTEAKDTWAAAGAVLVSGSAAWTEAKDTWAITGTVLVSGSAAWTEKPDIWAVSGTVANVIGGSAAWSEKPDVWAATGAVAISGSAAWTETQDAWAITGNTTLPAAVGTVSWAEVPDTWSIGGVNGQTGGHFLPLTKKHLAEQKKRLRKSEKAKESAEEVKRLDADSIAEEMRSLLLPKADPIEIKSSSNDDDEDEAIEMLLIYG